jgi:hypothetical protein
LAAQGGPKISIEAVEHSPKCLHNLSLSYLAIPEPNSPVAQVTDFVHVPNIG